MDTELEPTISALQNNVLACRDVADLALASAEQLEQIAHMLEDGVWQARVAGASADGADRLLTETERRLLTILTDTSGAWVRLMRVYCGNIEAAFAANPRLSAALPARSPLPALVEFWSEVDLHLKQLLQPARDAAATAQSESNSFSAVPPQRRAASARAAIVEGV